MVSYVNGLFHTRCVSLYAVGCVSLGRDTLRDSNVRAHAVRQNGRVCLTDVAEVHSCHWFVFTIC